MRAGQLNRLVTIQKMGPSRDEIGQPIAADWQDVASVWADIRHLSGSETIRAGAETSTVRASIRIRFRQGLDAGMRVVHKDTTYSVKAVLPDEARRVHVDLVCEVIK